MISKSFANSVNAAIFGGVPLEIDTWYVGLSMKELDENGNIPANAEPLNTGYARYKMKNNLTFFNTPQYYPTHPISSVTNAKPIMFMFSVTKDESIVSWFLSRDKEGITADVWGNFDKPMSITAGSQISIPSGNMFLTVNNP